ncbi:MAG: tetratricopeptide repeat protein [Solidesulfovibrio sp. DCME]|uniref:tetratricopeptide repeat protein n=1 Tax=Solidesulfovibrio sp. DCME TaxID=3447380 RepID=UPI003D0E3D61
MNAAKRLARTINLLVVALLWLPAALPAATSTNQLSSTNDTNYQTALAAIDNQDYSTALVYLNQALTSNQNNGYVYLVRAKLDLLYYLPSNAVTDANSAVALLRSSDICDQFLATDSPLLLNTSGYAYYGLTGASSYGSILNLTSITGYPTSTSTTSTGISGSSSTTSGTATGTTGTSTSATGTSSSSGTASTTSGNTSSTTTTSGSLFASSSGSQKLPVAEDLTDKDKLKNETMNEYNETLTEMSLYSSFCGGIYLNNLASLVEGYTVLGKGYLLGQNYAQAQQGFAAALSLDDDDAKAVAGLGLAYLGQGASSAALSELNLAVSYAPAEPAVYVARGAYWVSVGDWGRANEEYEAAVAQDASYLPAYASLGLLRALQGNYGSALEAYDKALSINANYVVALVARAATWTALAAATSNASQAATYTQNAQNDLAQAQKLQQTITNSATTTYSSTSWLTGYTPPYSTTTTTTNSTTPTIGTFY